jgi:hypothetical protein
MRIIILISTLFFSCSLFSQEDIAKMVVMDEFVVSAGLEDFDAEDFISQVINDTTFYQAFLNLKYYPHRVNSEILVFHKDESQKGKMYREAVQRRNLDSEMWIDIQFEKTNGRIKKRNGEWKYLTAEMYDDVFFPDDKEIVSNEIKTKKQELVSGSKLEKHKAQLKKMLFNPGQEIDNVPFIGDKLAIFDSEMVPYYDYAIFTHKWKDTIPTIAFSQFVKEGMEDDVVIRDMTSYFHQDTREVIAREYRLAHNTIFFDFDISIKVENQLIDGKIVPVRIDYDGAWDIPFKKPEIIRFYLDCYDYVIY